MPQANVLKQVRQTRRLELEAVASYAHISPARLKDFEEGKREPSFNQLERLADIYGAPAYALASEHFPNLQETLPDFRQPQPAPAHLSPGAMKKLWAVDNIATLTWQLTSELKFVANNQVYALKQQKISIQSAAVFREYFDEWCRDRLKAFNLFGSEENVLFTALRLFMESNGISVILDEAPSRDYFGFYSQAEGGSPAVFVNREVLSKKAQLFTLVHELCHHLLGQQGISDPFRRKNETERFCNRFAAEFLAPKAEFVAVVEREDRSARSDYTLMIEEVSRKTLLSNMATAIRLRENDYISQKNLSDYIKLRGRYSRAEKEDEKPEEVVVIGAPQASRISVLGYLSVYLAAEAVRAKVIDKVDVQQSLGLSILLQDRAFSLAGRRMRAALVR